MSKVQPTNPSSVSSTIVTPVRRSFTEEFKREAVRLAIERGNLSSVARDLGIADSVLTRWKRQTQGSQVGVAFPGNGNPRDAKMVKLQRELARVKEKNEILKKAVGISDACRIFTSRPQCQCACASEIPIYSGMEGTIFHRIALLSDARYAQWLPCLARTYNWYPSHGECATNGANTSGFREQSKNLW